MWGEIIAIYLLPEIWGSGVGSQLLQSALKKLKHRGFKNICLWVFKDNIRTKKIMREMDLQ